MQHCTHCCTDAQCNVWKQHQNTRRPRWRRGAQLATDNTVHLHRKVLHKVTCNAGSLLAVCVSDNQIPQLPSGGGSSRLLPSQQLIDIPPHCASVTPSLKLPPSDLSRLASTIHSVVALLQAPPQAQGACRAMGRCKGVQEGVVQVGKSCG